MNLREQFGKRLKELRNDRELTQNKLAERTDPSTSFISGLERGATAPWSSGRCHPSGQCSRRASLSPVGPSLGACPEAHVRRKVRYLHRDRHVDKWCRRSPRHCQGHNKASWLLLSLRYSRFRSHLETACIQSRALKCPNPVFHTDDIPSCLRNQYPSSLSTMLRRGTPE
jgi:DNA-binding XRE family transcriptional regulator